MRYLLETGCVDLESRELLRSGSPVRLQRRSFDVLCYLLRNRDRAVSRGELLDHCWRGMAVTDGSLSSCIRKLRKALGDDAKSPRLISTVHAHGYRFTGVVREQPPPVSTAEQAGAPCWHGLMGRATELDDLAKRWNAAREGRGGFVRIEGEPGVGKTALGSELLSLARQDGGLALHASALEVEGAPPLWLWTNVARSIAEQLEDATLRQVMALHAKSIARLLPDLAERVGHDPSHDAAPTERPWLLDALTQVLLRTSRMLPVCLVLDDLQSTDAESLRAVQLLLPSLGNASLLIVALHRPAMRRSPLSRAIGGWARAGFDTVWELGPLSEPDARRVVQREASLDGQSALATEITWRAKGNPLFLIELSRLAAGDPEAADDLPESLLRIVEARLSGVRRATERVLYAAATFGVGGAIDRKGLMEIAECSEQELLEALEEASAHDLLRPTRAEQARGLSFSHELVRDCIYELTPKELRQQLHRRSYEHIERSLGRSPHVVGLLRHHAEAMCDLDRLVAMASRVVQVTYELGTYRAASELASRTLSEHGPQMDADDLARLLLEHARALAAAGASFEQVAAIHAQVRDLGTPRLPPELAAESALEATGYGLFNGTTRRVGLALAAELELVEEALVQVSDRSTWSPILESWLACLLHRSARCAEAKEVSERALMRARKLQHPALLCATLLGHASVCAGGDDPGSRSAFALQALELAERVDRPALRVEALVQHMSARLSAGEGDETELEQMEKVVRESGREVLGVPCLYARIGWALARLDFTRARSLAQRAFELTQPMSPATAMVAPVTVELTCAQMCGKPAAWIPSLQETHDVTDGFTPMRGAMLANYVCTEDHEATARCLDEVMADLPGWQSHLDWLVLLGTCARATAMLRHKPHARTLAKLLAPHEDRFIVLADGLVLGGPVAQELAVLNDVLGRSQQADRLFAKAEQVCIRMNVQAPLLLTRSKWAESRWRRGDEGAWAQLHDLRAEAERIGYLSQAQELERLLETGNDMAPRQAWPDLSPRRSAS